MTQEFSFVRQQAAEDTNVREKGDSEMSPTLPQLVHSRLQTASRLVSEKGTQAEHGSWAELSRQSQSLARPNWLQFPGKNIREEGTSQREL